MKLGTAALHSSATMDASHGVVGTVVELSHNLIGRSKRFWADHAASLELARLGSLLRADIHAPMDAAARRECDRAHISAWVS